MTDNISIATTTTTAARTTLPIIKRLIIYRIKHTFFPRWIEFSRFVHAFLQFLNGISLCVVCAQWRSEFYRLIETIPTLKAKRKKEKDSRLRANYNYCASLIQCDLPERQKGNECGRCRKSASVSEKCTEIKIERGRDWKKEREREVFFSIFNRIWRTCLLNNSHLSVKIACIIFAICKIKWDDVHCTAHVCLVYRQRVHSFVLQRQC